MQELAPAPRLAARVAAVANRRLQDLLLHSQPPLRRGSRRRHFLCAWAHQEGRELHRRLYLRLLSHLCGCHDARLPRRKKKPPGNIPAASEENPTVQHF
jgi:hypothetical protein